MAKLTSEQRRERVSRLDRVAEQVAELLGADPERVMYDADANQLCIPVALVEQLLAKAGA